MTQCALVVVVILRHSTSQWAFRSIRQSASFQSYCSSLLSVLALGPTVILRVYSCLDLGPELKIGRCRISDCRSFFSCTDDSDRLMKRASCCIFVCVVLAAAYLKYRRYRLSCFPFVWHCFHCDTRKQASYCCCFLCVMFASVACCACLSSGTFFSL